MTNFLEEAKANAKVQYVLHKHEPRNGSTHYDLRFLDKTNKKLLHSFAFGSDFLEKVSTKITGVKTKDHDPRWLTLKSYRLEEIESGVVEMEISSKSFYRLIFKGKVLKGEYELFKLKTKRGDNWLLIKRK